MISHRNWTISYSLRIRSYSNRETPSAWQLCHIEADLRPPADELNHQTKDSVLILQNQSAYILPVITTSVVLRFTPVLAYHL